MFQQLRRIISGAFGYGGGLGSTTASITATATSVAVNNSQCTIKNPVERIKLLDDAKKYLNKYKRHPSIIDLCYKPEEHKERCSFLLEKIEHETRIKLKDNLRPSQLKGIINICQRRKAIPQHFLKIDPLTIVPTKGPHPSLSFGKRKTGGRNNTGKITCRHRGGGFKRKIRTLDRLRSTPGEYSVVRIEHDPNRSAKIALVRRKEDSILSYVLAWDGAEEGSRFTIISSPSAELGDGEKAILGSVYHLCQLPINTFVHSIEFKPGSGSKIAMSAGCKAIITAKDDERRMATISLPSKRSIVLSYDCKAVVGAVGNGMHSSKRIGKAGRMRNLGRRPVVRGVAMNPVDHPHGGGSGGRSKGHHSRSIWGWHCK